MYSPIPGYPDYRISRSGDLQSCKRGDWVSLKPRKGPLGYYYVTLFSPDAVGFTISHHRLVATIFLPKNGFNVVSHKNHDRGDNRVENLEWTDQKGNMRRSKQDGRLVAGETCGHAKLTQPQVDQIRALYQTGKITHQQLADRFGVLRRAIGDIINRVTWRGE